MILTWDNQNLVFNYYFPTYGHVFTGSPIDFVGDGSANLSTLSTLDPATFSVSNVSASEEQISYTYPLAAYPNGLGLVNQPFNGFTISGPSGDGPIVAVQIDSNSNVTGLTNSELSFSNSSVTINLAGDDFTPGSVGLIDVTFAAPEPASVVSLAFGLLSVFAIRRLKRS